MFEWIIRNVQNHDEFWNDRIGWTDWYSAYRFPSTDYWLVPNGEWVEEATVIPKMENTNA